MIWTIDLYFFWHIRAQQPKATRIERKVDARVAHKMRRSTEKRADILRQHRKTTQYKPVHNATAHLKMECSQPPTPTTLPSPIRAGLHHINKSNQSEHTTAPDTLHKSKKIANGLAEFEPKWHLCFNLDSRAMFLLTTDRLFATTGLLVSSTTAFLMFDTRKDISNGSGITGHAVISHCAFCGVSRPPHV